MSIIYPAGKRIEWAPKVEKKAEFEDADSQFDAIKGLPGIKEEVSTLGLDKMDEVKEIVEQAKEAIEKVVEVVQEVVGEAKPEEKKDEKAPEAKDGKKDDEVVEIEVELEPSVPGVKEDGKVEVEKEGIQACAAKAVKAEEKKCDACKKSPCECKKEKKEEKKASTGPVFLKISELSPENRKDLDTYWKGLGLPAEYVDAMLHNYEEK
jgi:gas vesicle protein